jgi:NAD(P)-dependent dehydrogenase (short-subunit alcohol dehydrogenase family)
LVTGASKGIGDAIAQNLAAEGASVVVNDAFHKEDGNREVTEITQDGGKAIAIQANVSRKPMSSSCVAEAENVFGRVDILVNNAGVYEFRPLESPQRRALSAAFGHPCPRPDPGLAAGREAFRFLRREHHQYRFLAREQHGECHEGCSECGHNNARHRVGAAEHPRQFHQPGW